MIDWFDAHAGSLTVLVTFVLVLITAYYAKQTHDQVTAAARASDEARQLNADQVAAQFRPMLVLIDMALQPAMFQESDTGRHPSQLIVENVGVGAALNVAAQVTRKNVPGYQQAVVMIQFGETRIGNIGAAPRRRCVSSTATPPFNVRIRAPRLPTSLYLSTRVWMDGATRLLSNDTAAGGGTTDKSSVFNHPPAILTHN
jgi:hypothetical protein